MRKTGRKERVVELRAQGLSNPQIAEMEGCNRVTIWRITKDLPEPGPVVLDIRPAPAHEDEDAGTAPAGKLLSLDDLSLGVSVLRDRARRGSIAAARDLARLSVAEIRAGAGCREHVTVSDLQVLMASQFDMWRQRLLGPFARRVSLEFGIELGAFEKVIQAAIDDVGDEMDARREAAQNAQGVKE